MGVETRIKELCAMQEPYVKELRRYFHENPETSLKEYGTHQRIVQELDALGIPWKRVGECGIIGVLDSGKPGRTLVLRSDMDALPIVENPENLAGSKICISKKEGAAHLCGHDGHMSMTLGAAKVLNAIKGDWCGRILLCFEQAEENGGGIDDMLKALEAYELDGCWAIHLYAGLDSKKVSLQAGPRMSSVAGYDIRIVGRGGHGSRPDLCRNPAGCIVDIISLVPGMMKARLNPAYPVVFSIGEIHVGTKGNIIAEDGYFSGTLRYFDYEAGVKAMEILCSVSEEIARLHGCSVDYMRKIITDNAVINDEKLSNMAELCVRRDMEDLEVVRTEPWYATESFGRYQHRCPGVLALLGIRNPEVGSGEEHHNPRFDIDEAVLVPGVEMTVRFAAEFLQ